VSSLSFELVVEIHCLAALDLGAGFEPADITLKHYIAVFLFFSVNISGYYIQRNVSGVCNFIFV